MILASTPSSSPGRPLRALLFAAAVALLPLGIAASQDIEAVSERLVRAVRAGELSPEDAAAMVGALAQRKFLKRLHEHHEHHEHHDGAAQEQLHELAQAFLKLGLEERTFDKVVSALHEAGVHDKRLHHSLGGMLKAIHMARHGQDIRWLTERLEGAGLEAPQVKRVWALTKRLLGALEGHSAPPAPHGLAVLGLSKEELGRIQEALSESGVPDEAMGDVLGAMNKALAQLQEGAEDIGWLKPVLAKLGLEPPAIERAWNLTQRLGHRVKPRDSKPRVSAFAALGFDEATVARLKARLAAAGLGEEAQGPVLELIGKALSGLSRGEKPEWLDAELGARLGDEAQVRVVKELVKELHAKVAPKRRVG